jgi:hypothetical protein
MRRAVGRHWLGSGLTLMAVVWMLSLFFWQHADRAVAAETLFLQDGRTIQADKVEIVGDTVRVQKPSETIELHRSEVLSIHHSSAPGASPGPADVYRDTTRQMNDKVRREIEERPGGSSVR